jgi:hypothetical protein
MAVGAATILVVAAAGLWLFGFLSVDGRDCPRHGRAVQVGLDTDRSTWPPGVDCRDADGSFVVQKFDGLGTVVLVLATGAGAVLAVGTVGAAWATRLR